MDLVGLVYRTAARAGLHVERAPSFATVPGQLKRIFPLHHVDCVLDVGANVGQFARSVREIGFGGRIVSYEPVSTAYQALEAAAAQDPSWHAVDVALGDQTETVSINVTRETSVSSFLDLNGFHITQEDGQVVRTEEVRVERLADRFDDDVDGCSRIWLKIDTQGYDLAVLEGARSVLDRVIGMQLEVSVQPIYEGQPHWLDVIAAAEDLGFVTTGLLNVARRPDLSAIELDAVFVRKQPQVGR